MISAGDRESFADVTMHRLSSHQLLLCPADFEKHISDAEIIVTTPFHPAQITRERLAKAEKLKLLLTAGIGSDHVDLHAAADNNLTVAEVQGTEAPPPTTLWCCRHRV